MGKYNTTIATVIIGLIFASPANALEPLEAFFLQKTLNEHGYNVGKADGKIGTATREQIRAFSKDHSSPSDPDELFSWIVRESARHSEVVSSTVEINEITAKVSRSLKDPSSAVLRNVRIVQGPKHSILCGEVNGKNSYGAFAGFTPFMSIGPYPGMFTVYHLDDSAGGVAFYTCLTSIPKRK